MRSSIIIIILIVLIVSSIPFSLNNENINTKIAVQNNYTVNPQCFYKNEPAPMGIVDYGIGNNNSGFAFNTTAFTGAVNISSIRTDNSSLPCPYNMTIQLNSVLQFNYNGKNYTYWIQDVALVNTNYSIPKMEIIDNVWNFSSPAGVMLNSTISGNGTVENSTTPYYFSYYHYYINSNEIQFREASFTHDGYPEIYMEFENNGKWTTFDTLNFTFADNAMDYNFVVNGNHYDNIPKNGKNEVFAYDAGLILGGPGNGTSTKAIAMNLTMELDYWNGHNWQAITSAYSAGSDTAETISNVTDIPVINENETGVQISTGNGQPSLLYTPANLSILNFTSTFNNANYITLNGRQYNFTDNSIELTLAPGSYNLSLFTDNGEKIFSQNYTLQAGNTYNFSSTNVYLVKFMENGLKNNISWSVEINNTIYSAKNSMLYFYLTNGSYTYSVLNISNYNVIDNRTGNITVNGHNQEINITFNMINKSSSINTLLENKYAVAGFAGILGLMIVGIFLFHKRKKKYQ